MKAMNTESVITIILGVVLVLGGLAFICNGVMMIEDTNKIDKVEISDQETYFKKSID